MPASCRGKQGWVWYGTGRGVFNWGNGTTGIGHEGWRVVQVGQTGRRGRAGEVGAAGARMEDECSRTLEFPF